MYVLTEEERKKIRVAPLAEKHKCTPQYVRAVLRGARNDHSKKARAILADARRILEIVNARHSV